MKTIPIAYQAIATKFLGPTNTKPSRYRAKCDRGSIVISAHYNLNVSENHVRAAECLVAKFLAEDEKSYKSDPMKNPWAQPFITGVLPDGSFAHVFTPKAEGKK